MTVGGITFAVTVIAAIAAWSARETYRIRLRDLGDPIAVSVDEHEYALRRPRAAGGAAN